MYPSSPSIQPKNSNFLNYKVFPILLFDYILVITIYVSAAFWLAILIDGHILPKYDEEKARKTKSYILYFEILLQLAVQGFLAIFIAFLLCKIPSPFNGIAGYNSNSPDGSLLRNPAIITVILLSLSISLQGRLRVLFSRFDKNSVDGLMMV